ncbi:Rv3654c family TadE-like protein [Arthrobacter sp. TMN-49]
MTSAEEGAGTVLAAALALALLLLTAMVMWLGQAAVAAGQAATAADLAALAAADAYRGLSTGVPCQVAADVSAHHGATLVECRLVGAGSVQVNVAIQTSMPWSAYGRARAGPPPGYGSSRNTSSGYPLRGVVEYDLE